MPRRSLGPRLYLDKRRREWVVRSGSKFKRTGVAENDHDKAHAALTHYMKIWRAERTIYFITCLEEHFPIKIGSTVDLNARMTNLRTALPYQPVLLASFNGDTKDESNLHQKFSHFRLHGEWFRRTPELMGYIATLRTFETLPELKVPKFSGGRCKVLIREHSQVDPEIVPGTEYKI